MNENGATIQCWRDENTRIEDDREKFELGSWTSVEQKETLDVSIVFPACNEVDTLEEAVKRTMSAIELFTGSYEIVIAEDGSTDGTDMLAKRLCDRFPTVKHFHGDVRLGRGIALKTAFKKSRGAVLIYMDVDLATDLKHLKSLYDAILDGYDFATGSRLLSGSRVERSVLRQISSSSYNFLVRLILGSKIRDHQCGFKAFSRESVWALLDEIDAHHWFWDTELFVRAARKGYRIKEIPVKWDNGRKTKVNLLSDSWSMGWQILRLWALLR